MSVSQEVSEHQGNELLLQKPFSEYQQTQSTLPENLMTVPSSCADQSEEKAVFSSQSNKAASPDAELSESVMNMDQSENVVVADEFSHAHAESGAEAEEALDGGSGVQSSTDSEDSIPLSQLKHRCILYVQAKKSAMKVEQNRQVILV